MSVVHLNTFSSYTLLSSTIMPEKLAEKAKEYGYEAVALTDRNAMYGVVPFYKACLRHSLRPIIGLTADVLPEGAETGAAPLILLAKDNDGLKNLLKISSAILVKSPEGIPVKWLKHYTKGLIAITPGREGEIGRLLLQDEDEKALQRAAFYRELFGEAAFYIGLQKMNVADEKKLEEKIFRLSEATGIPCAAAPKVLFLRKEDYAAWKILEAIRENTTVENLSRPPFEKELYFKTPAEMEAMFSDCPEALENAAEIARQCDVRIPLNEGFLLPKYPLSGKSADRYLRELCEAGLARRVRPVTPEYRERLEYELNVITEMKYSDYFLIVWDFVRFAKENGILVGPGRGSAAGSLVAYALGITDVDPIKFQLLFERFLNPDRISMPDIDIDFPDHRRDEVIRYVARKYGSKHVAQIITFGTFQAKAAMRDTARVFGLSGKELEQISRAIPSRPGLTLKEAAAQSEELRRLIQREPFRRIYQISLKIEGLPRHTSTHAAGVVISGMPLIEMVPLQKGHEEILLTQYPMGILEELGLLKMDFLGLRNLTIMESIVRMIREKANPGFDMKNISFRDEKTYRLLQSGNTTGVFQLESEGMRKVLTELKPTEFEDIVAVNALYRPGPMQFIPVYIRRKHGLEKVRYPHEDLEPILKKTYGVIVYQEQIMQIASTMAGFTLGQADLLRRAVSKKKREILDKERSHFVSGAVERGYPEAVADQVYDMIVRFADYGFPRSHAVAYSVIAYQLAYLKAHYPLYFMATLLSSVIGHEEKIAEYIRELKRMGFSVLGPSINRSGRLFSVEGNAVRMSLACIKGVGVQAIKEILRAREERPFEDLFDFCLRVSLRVVNRKVMEALVKAGCFDEFGQDRATLLASLDAALEHAAIFGGDGRQLDMFNSLEQQFKPKYVTVEPMPVMAKLLYEKELMGVFVSKHPASYYRDWFLSQGSLFLDEIKSERRYVKVGVWIAEEKKIRTKDGEPMAFLTISDESGEMDAVVFPDVYRKFGGRFKKDAFALLAGIVEKRNNRRQFVVKDARFVD